MALGGTLWEVAGVKYLHAALLVVGIWLAGECAWTVHRVRPHLEVTLSNLDRTIIVAGVAATHLEKASNTWEKSSMDQSRDTTKFLALGSKTMLSLNNLLVSTNSSLNSQLLPSLSNAIREQNESLLESQKRFQSNLSESQKVLADADAQINNPAIKESVDSLAEAAQNTASATNEAAASMKTIRTGLDYELKQLMAPVTKAKAALNISLLVIRRLFF